MSVTENTHADKKQRDVGTPPSRTRVNWSAAFWPWHSYGAVPVIPVLLVLITSNLTYMYRAQIDARTHPGVLTFTAPNGAEDLPLSQQEQSVRETFPDRDILSIADNTGDRSTVFVTADGDDSRRLYVDPYCGEVTDDLAPTSLVSDWAERHPSDW